MRDFLHLQAKRTQITILIIFIIIGFLLISQWRGRAGIRHKLIGQPEQDLGQIIRQLTLEAETLRLEISQLQFQLYDYERKAEDNKAILNEAQKNLQDLKISAGLLRVKGPGVRIVLTDKKETLDTFDFLDLIQELKVAGAEGISINGKRVVAQSYFQKKKGAIYVNKEKISPPYEIKAIGNPDVLYQGLTLAGGVKDRLSSLQGVNLKLTEENDLFLPAVGKKFETAHITP